MQDRLRAGGEGTTEDEMVGWHHRPSGHEFELMGVGDGQGSRACCGPWSLKVSDCLRIWTEQKDAVFLWNPLYWTITTLWAFVGFGDDLLWLSWFANISLHSRLPSFLKVSFFGHLLWNWSRSHFPGFGLFLIALGDGFQKTLQGNHPNPKRPLSLYPRMFYVFLKTLIGSLLTFRYLWFGVHFVYSVREYAYLILVFFVLISLLWSFIVSLASVYY